jgi:predicted RNA-binding Zn-ribbon protein involved in translation (DUF1610 family)
VTTPTPTTDKRRCASCGADLTIGEGIVVLACPLCGSRAIGTSKKEWES